MLLAFLLVSVPLWQILTKHFDDSRRTVAEVLADLHVEPRLEEELLPFLYLAAVHPDHDGEGAVDLGGRLDDSLGDHVAAHDAAEDVDEHPFDVLVLEDDLERLRHLLPSSSPPHVEEVGRF